MTDTALAEILYDGEEVQVLHQPGASAYTLVTFGLMHSRANGHNFWGEKLVARAGLDCIAVMPKSANWFPPALMEAPAAAIRAAADRPLVTYGTSMGAYGALRYSAAIGAETAIAFAPQTTIDPDLVGGFDPRYRRYFRPDWHSGSEIRAGHLAPRAWVFHDPTMRFDRFHVERLSEMPEIAEVTLPYTGHKPVATAASSAVALEMIGACRSGDAAALRHILLARRKRLPDYFLGLAEELRRRGQFGRVLAVADAGLARFPGSPDLHILRAAAFEALGERGAAIAAAERAVGERPGHHLAQLRLAELRLAHGRVADAARGLEAALADIEHPMLYRRLAEACDRLGRHADAVDAIGRALASWPGNPVLEREHARLVTRRDEEYWARRA